MTSSMEKLSLVLKISFLFLYIIEMQLLRL